MTKTKFNSVHELTEQEQFDIYMKQSKKKLAMMLIESNKLLTAKIGTKQDVEEVIDEYKKHHCLCCNKELSDNSKGGFCSSECIDKTLERELNETSERLVKEASDTITEMHSIASFNKIVKNYCKMKKIENEIPVTYEFTCLKCVPDEEDACCQVCSRNLKRVINANEILIKEKTTSNYTDLDKYNLKK